jgi:hypothetical protein
MASPRDHILLRRSEKGEISLFDERDNFQASFRGEAWTSGRIFQSHELEEFTILEDDDEISRILTEARTALNRPLPTR